MQAVVFYLTLPFIYLVSILPFRMLYLLSDVVFFLMYRVLGYRKKVVFENLRRSFPGHTEQEIRDTGKQFYRFLCDLFLETFKTLTISRESMLRHCRLNESAKTLLESFAVRNQNIILVMGHHGNWEWGGNTFSLECGQQLFVIYHPLKNKYFNDLIVGMRTRFGTKLIPMADTFREMVRNKKTLSATAFIADQTPQPDHAYWTSFLHQDTPVFWGTERISKKMNYPVVYIHISRVKRGYYEMSAEMLVPDPKATADTEISELFTRQLEQKIKQEPETWLWSHRRWKHRRPA